MNKTFVALWLLLVTAIVAIAVLAFLWTAQRHQDARRRAVFLLQEQLEPYNRDVSRILADYELQLQRQLTLLDLTDIEAISFLRRFPLVDQVIVVDRESRMIYPRIQDIAMREQSLILDAHQVLADRSFLPNSVEQGFTQNNRNVSRAGGRSGYFQSNRLANNSSSSGWTTWYHQRSIILGYWWQRDSGDIAMIIVPRARWMADIIAELPSQGALGYDNKAKLGRCELVDSEGKVIYQWGGTSTTTEPIAAPDAELAVVEPLDAWRLRMFASPEGRQLAIHTANTLPMIFGVAGLSVALVLLGVMATINLQRAMRVASQRVSFVNHVSHELRTPLTNIRMYADMLYDQLQRDEELAGDSQYTPDMLTKLNVVRQESERLGRLISNVLSFARAGNKHSSEQIVEVDVEEIIDEVLQLFEPQLLASKFTVERQRGLVPKIRSDRSALMQILVNLVGNVEKYGASGKYLSVATRHVGDYVEICVQDHGPGIAPSLRDKIFQPFFRISDALHEPAGTGIGLTISRQLARQLGGDCELRQSSQGACFCVRIRG